MLAAAALVPLYGQMGRNQAALLALQTARLLAKHQANDHWQHQQNGDQAHGVQASHREETAEPHMPARVRIPLRQHDHGGAVRS